MKRSEIELKYTWDLSDILQSKDEFLSRIKSLEEDIDFSAFKGKLNNSKTIKACFDKLYSVLGELEVLSVYSMLKRDEDGSDPLGTELCCYVENVSVKFSAEISFIEPELSKLSKKKLI